MLTFLLVSLLMISVYGQRRTEPVITDQGLVQGLIVNEVNSQYHAFYNIHYGGDTSGQNRFKPPTPPSNYTNIFEAIDERIVCPQIIHDSRFRGSEDCLRLSIISKPASSELKPVMVWLDGEDFSNSFPLKHSFSTFVNRDIMIVAVNYRVGVFGFLCLGTDDAPGNLGLRDVMQALAWVQRNIEAFGGNPHNVVLAGHGSGAAVADLITLSPSSKNLVHKVIAMSGSAVAPWAITRNPVEQAFKLGRKLNYDGENRKDLLEMLSKNSQDNLVAAELSVTYDLTNTVAFAPCIENPKRKNTFLEDAPVNLLEKGSYNDVPYIYSYVNREGTIRAPHASDQRNWLEAMNTDFSKFLPVDLKLNETQQNEIRNFYFGTKNIDLTTIEEYLDYHGDTLILRPVIWSATRRARRSKANLWLMEFQHRGTNNSNWPYPEIPLNGTAHGQLLNYLLKFDLTNHGATFSNRVIDPFVNFVKTGYPGVTWRTVGTMTWARYLVFQGTPFLVGDNITNIGSTITEINPPWQRKIEDLWDDLYKNYYDAPSSAPRFLSIGILLLFCQLLAN